MKTIKHIQKPGTWIFIFSFLLYHTIAYSSVRISGPEYLCPLEKGLYSFIISDIKNGYYVSSTSWGVVDYSWAGVGPLSVDVTYTNYYFPYDSYWERGYINIKEKPEPLISNISGLAYLPCQSTAPVTYSAFSSNATQYVWKLPSGWSGSSSSSSITVIPSQTSTGTISVYAVVNTECGLRTTNTSYLNIDRNPPMPEFVNPELNVCSGTTKIYTVSSVPEVSNYIWNITGASIVSGQGTNSIEIQFGSPRPVILSVVASNSCGNSLATSIIVLYGPPSTPSYLYFYDRVNCKIAARGSEVSNATAYEWSDNNFASIFLSTSIPFIGTVLPYQTIYIRPVNMCGIGSVSSGYVDPEYICDPYWNSYRTQSTELEKLDNIFVASNPANNSFEINVPNIEKIVNVKVFNLQGQVVKEFSIVNSKTTMGTTELSAGLYLIHINSGEINVIKKIQIIK